MTLERLADGTLGTRLLKIISLRQQYVNGNVAPPVEGAIRRLQFAPILFKEATKPTDKKYISMLRTVAQAFSKLPHISEIDLA
jgi:hypothetical protein